MRLTFLGKETQGGGSPTLFTTDQDTYVVQGWRVPGKQTSVEIPKKLLRHLEGRATVFAEDGCFRGGREITDRTVIDQCCKVREQVWALAIPHRKYVSL